MSTHSRSHHLSTGLAKRSPHTVRIDGRSYPASQRDLVAASLLARPDKADDSSNRPMSWSRP